MASTPRLVRHPDRLGLPSVPLVALLALGLTISLASLASAPPIGRSVALVAISSSPLAPTAHAVAFETLERPGRRLPIAATDIPKIADEHGSASTPPLMLSRASSLLSPSRIWIRSLSAPATLRTA